MATTLETLGIDRMSIPERLALAQEIWTSINTEAIASQATVGSIGESSGNT